MTRICDYPVERSKETPVIPIFKRNDPDEGVESGWRRSISAVQHVTAQCGSCSLTVCDSKASLEGQWSLLSGEKEP